MKQPFEAEVVGGLAATASSAAVDPLVAQGSKIFLLRSFAMHVTEQVAAVDRRLLL